MLRRVLCVEDDPLTTLLTRHLLEKASFSDEILSSGDGQQALEVFSAGKPGEINLILLDLNMPVKDGWEFLDEFCHLHRSAHPETRVVIVSSSLLEKDFKKAEEYDIVLDFVSKPLTSEHLEKLKGHDALRNYFTIPG